MKRNRPDFITRNWPLKLLAFVLAFFVWLNLIPEEKTYSEKRITTVLETPNIPSKLELVEKPVPTIDVVVRAPNRIINGIGPANVHARLDLGKATVYQEEYPLYKEMIAVPQGAEVVSISPNKVNLKLERTEQLELEIAPVLVGKIGEGFHITKIVVNPQKAVVRGPESMLKPRDKVTTSPINISALTENSEFEADLILPRPDLRLATSQVRVKVAILVEKTDEPAKAPKRAQK